MLLTFLLILGASFAAMAALLTALVSNSLYAQRTRQASLQAQKLALSAAPFFENADLAALSPMLREAAAQEEGRILLTDAYGKVMWDSFALLEGSVTKVPEVAQVLSGGDAHALGVHTRHADAAHEDAAALCAAAITADDGQVVGALLLSMPVTELHAAIQAVERQLATVFLAVAGAALIAALVFSVTLTRPIQAITATIRRMGRGDLTARVRVRASGEMRTLADSYNAMAEQIENFDRSRSQFVQNASHELKTPLATMKLLLENLIYQPDMPAELRAEFMQDMDHEIDRLSGIITDLLTLSQVDSQSGASLTLSETDLSLLAEDAMHALMPAAGKADLSLTGDIAPDVTMQADESKLGQVFYNLIDNAIKYTPAGGHVRVTLAQRGREAVFTVQDDGIGIPEADVPHIFDRFYRVDKARSRQSGGTGLGLSIVRQMAQLHGGTVSVSPAPEKGSVFTVVLPLRKEGAA